MVETNQNKQLLRKNKKGKKQTDRHLIKFYYTFPSFHSYFFLVREFALQEESNREHKNRRGTTEREYPQIILVKCCKQISVLTDNKEKPFRWIYKNTTGGQNKIICGIVINRKIISVFLSHSLLCTYALRTLIALLVCQVVVAWHSFPFASISHLSAMVFSLCDSECRMRFSTSVDGSMRSLTDAHCHKNHKGGKKMQKTRQKRDGARKNKRSLCK